MAKLPFLSLILKVFKSPEANHQNEVNILLGKVGKLTGGSKRLKSLPKDIGISVLRTLAENQPGRTLPSNILARMAHSQLA